MEQAFSEVLTGTALANTFEVEEGFMPANVLPDRRYDAIRPDY
jgi:hypothetical protein